MSDPRVGSIDIETYGACETNHCGTPLPLQTVFHPNRSIHTDKVTLEDLIVTVSLTLPLFDPRPTPSSPWTGSLISKLEPGASMCAQMHIPSDVENLARWLLFLDTLIGKDLSFDLTYLLRIPRLRRAIRGTHTILDVSYLNFLHSDVRPEKSLKDLGPVLGTHCYNPDHTLREGRRFPSPLHPDHIDYNCQDTHNSLTSAARLASLTESEFPAGSVLNADSIYHWSSVVWGAVRMQDAGIPMSRPRLYNLGRSLSKRAAAAADSATAFGLILSGKGSPASKLATINAAYDVVNEQDLLSILGPPPRWDGINKPTITQYPVVDLTRVKRELSTSTLNRRVALALLPPSHPLVDVLKVWQEHTDAQGQLSKYVEPLLSKKSSKQSKSPYDSILLRHPAARPGTEITYPKWFIVPGSFKDSGGGTGGQRQIRPSCQSPQAQQWQTALKECMVSMFPGGSILAPDLNQIELRAAGILSGDRSLVTAYRDNRNLHKERAVLIYGPEVVHNSYFKTGDTANDPYQWAKRINFADLYDAQAKRMQKTLLEDSGRIFPLSFFYEIINNRPLVRPGLVEWQQRTAALATKQGYILMPLTGHHRSFVGGDDDEHNEILNFPVQSLGAATLWAIIHELHLRLPPLTAHLPLIRFFMNWFDACFFDCHPSMVSHLKEQWAASVEHVATRGYWARMCDITGHHIPLAYEMKEHLRC
jgi:hypothetical protein